MRLTTKIHGIVDYLVALVLIALPWVVGIGIAGPAGIIPILAGLAVALNAVATDFELGALKRLQIPLHLWIDGFVGLLLAVSPWILSFDQIIWLPHVIFGLLIMGLAFLTDTVPGYDRRRSPSPAR
jgi:hypothetical protein